MTGRKPRTPEQQIAAGDPRRHGVNKLQERAESAVKATPGLPQCPAHLKGVAREAWEFWATELAVMKMAKRPDAMMLEGACVSYEAAVDAYIQIQSQGRVVEDPIVSRKTGEIVGHRMIKNPWVEVQTKALMLVKSFCCEFGLAPVPRTRLSIEIEDDSEETLLKLLTTPRSPRPVQ